MNNDETNQCAMLTECLSEKMCLTHCLYGSTVYKKAFN